jgi:hypothetical protein
MARVPCLVWLFSGESPKSGGVLRIQLILNHQSGTFLGDYDFQVGQFPAGHDALLSK